MKRLILPLLTLAIVGCQPAPDPAAQYWKNWGDVQLSSWSESSDQLLQETQRYCTSMSSLTDLQNQWQETFLIWSSINGFPYKGIADLTLEFELYFWPDRRNRVEGQLRQRLAQDAQANPELLETRIAAEKGLAALEWLLFAADTSLEQRCNLVPGTSEDYRNKVVQVAEYHQDNPVIPDAWLTSEGTAQSNSISLNLLFSQITALESRLSGSTDNDMYWLAREAYGWRSGMTHASFEASVLSLLNHLENLSGRPELEEDTLTALNNLITRGTDIRNLIATDEDSPAILGEWLNDLETLLQNSISRDFDVLIGFNNFDGD